LSSCVIWSILFVQIICQNSEKLISPKISSPRVWFTWMSAIKFQTFNLNRELQRSYFLLSMQSWIAQKLTFCTHLSLSTATAYIPSRIFLKRCKICVGSCSISSGTRFSINLVVCLKAAARLMIGPSSSAQRKGACSSTGCQHFAGQQHTWPLSSLSEYVIYGAAPLRTPRVPPTRTRKKKRLARNTHTRDTAHAPFQSRRAIILIREKKTAAQYAYETRWIQKL